MINQMSSFKRDIELTSLCNINNARNTSTLLNRKHYTLNKIGSEALETVKVCL